MAARKQTFKPVKFIEVYLWGILAGKIVPDTNRGAYAFRYDDDFRRLGIEPSPLMMPVRDLVNWTFPNLSKETFRGLPPLISDALPDNFGNSLIEGYLASFYGMNRQDIKPLDRLAYMGSRGMGALHFKPPRGEVKGASAIELEGLVLEARKALSGSLEDAHAADSLRHIIDVGTSAGGARPKAVICWNPITKEIRSGQFDAPEGFEHWLIKFDIDQGQLNQGQDFGRIEYAYHLMALAAGINMTECRLEEEGGRAHFMTRRFDREGGSGKHHAQTLCAMAHLDFNQRATHSYEQMFQAIIALNLPDEDLYEAYRRMVFNVLARNCDDHTKNTSFILKKGQAWRLAPAYDVTFAHNPSGGWTSQHLMSVNGRFRDFSKDDLLAVSDPYSIGPAKRIFDQVRSAISRWPEFADQAGLPTVKAQEIQSMHLRL